MNVQRFLRLVFHGLIVLVAAYTVAFLLLEALPSDAVTARYSRPEMGLSPEQIEKIRQAYGADKPIYVRYFSILCGFFTGNLGNSFQFGTSVTTLLGHAFPSTLFLSLTGFSTAVILAAIVATIATYAHQNWIRKIFHSVPSVMISLPVFWIGIVLLQIFSFRLGWIRSINPSPIQALILPSLALAIPIGAPLAEVLITSIDKIQHEDFIDVVKARGAKPGWILRRNVLRNATIPALTVGGVLFTELISNAVITETVFGIKGIGSLTVDAVATRDTPVLLSIVVLCALLFVVISILIEILHPIIDHRIQLEHLS